MSDSIDLNDIKIIPASSLMENKQNESTSPTEYDLKLINDKIQDNSQIMYKYGINIKDTLNKKINLLSIVFLIILIILIVLLILFYVEYVNNKNDVNNKFINLYNLSKK